MIDSVLNLLFRCRHRRLTRPLAPITRPGEPQSRSYVVCLDCGKQFEYDVRNMRIGKPIGPSHDMGVVDPEMPERKTKMRFALLATLPATFLFGALMKGKKRAAKAEDDK